MLYGLIVFLLYLLLGEFVAHLFTWPVPGSVLGMLLLFLTLMVRGGVNADLQKTSNGLLPYLPLFIVPASVGIVNFMGLIEQEGIALFVAIVGSLLVGIPMCGLLAQWMIKRPAHSGDKK